MKLKKLLLTGLTLSMLVGTVQMNLVEKVDAASYSSLSASNKKVFDSIVKDKSNVTSITVGSPTVSVSGISAASSYQWTAWYNKNTKNFTIDKTKTNGTYTTGFPKSTTSASTSTNFSKVGWYKYLRDPIYKDIYLTATQTFKWTTRKEVPVPGTYKLLETYGRTDIPITTKDGTYATLANCITKMTGLEYSKVLKELENDVKVNVITDSGSDKGRVEVDDTCYIVSDKDGDKVTYRIEIDITSKKSDNSTDTSTNHGKAHVVIKIYKKTDSTKYRYTDYAKTVTIARTKVASNASATEMDRYANFKLLYKGGSTSAKNTTITKNQTSWWGKNVPAYHKGVTKTTDSSGGQYYYYFSNSASGTSYANVDLYSKLTKKEKLFTEQAKDENAINNPDNTYTLTINPNGGLYNGKTGNTTYTKKINSSLSIANPIRPGYTFINWEHTGEGTWDASKKIFTFTGVGTLKAKWIKTSDLNNGAKYTLSINPNGGKYNHSSKVKEITQELGTTYKLSIPTRSGYIFDGWQVTSGNPLYLTQSKYGYESSFAFYGNATITAKWIENDSNKDNGDTAKLIIDPNGGIWNGSSNKTTLTKKVGTYLSIENPTRDNYIFSGWEIDTNDDVNGIFNTSSHSYLFKRGTSTLKARWKKSSPTSCVIDGIGANACPDDRDRIINKFIHLTKNLD